MRIRTQKDVDILEDRIKTQLGVDVGKYRNEEVVETFVDLLVFPEYIIKWVIRPVFVALLIYIVGFKLLDLVHIEFLIYAVFGIGLFLSTGLLLGLILLLDRLRIDMWGVIDFSIGIMKEAVSDLKQANNSITDENRIENLGLLFKGIIHIVTIPLLSRAISQRVPFVGGIINVMTKKVLILVSDKIRFDGKKLNERLTKIDAPSNVYQDLSTDISSDASGLEKVLAVTFRIAKFPLLFGFICSFITLLIFIYLIN